MSRWNHHRLELLMLHDPSVRERDAASCLIAFARTAGSSPGFHPTTTLGIQVADDRDSPTLSTSSCDTPPMTITSASLLPGALRSGKGPHERVWQPSSARQSASFPPQCDIRHGE